MANFEFDQDEAQRIIKQINQLSQGLGESMRQVRRQTGRMTQTQSVVDTKLINQGQKIENQLATEQNKLLILSQVLTKIGEECAATEIHGNATAAFLSDDGDTENDANTDSTSDATDDSANQDGWKFLGFTADGGIETSNDWDNGNIGIDVHGNTEAYIGKGSANYDGKWVRFKLEEAIGDVAASGSISANLFKDGKLDPAIKAELVAKAVAAELSDSIEIGTEDVNVHADSTVDLGYAKGEVSAKVDSEGASVNVGANASVVHGEATAGIDIFGYHIDFTTSGDALGVGASAEAEFKADDIEIGAAADFLVGLGLKIHMFKK